MWTNPQETADCFVFLTEILHKRSSFFVLHCINQVNYNKQTSANICLFKVNNRNTKKRCEMCSKLSVMFLLVNFEHIWHLFLVFLLLTLNSKWYLGRGIFRTLSNIHDSTFLQKWLLNNMQLSIFFYFRRFHPLF